MIWIITAIGIGAALAVYGVVMMRRARKFTEQSGLTPPDKWGDVSCLECGRAIGRYCMGHANSCSQIGRAELVDRLDRAERGLQDYRKKRYGSPWAKKMSEQVTLWRGKYLMVKQENNALRRKLRAHESEQPPEPT